jgi:hypothetical protein
VNESTKEIMHAISRRFAKCPACNFVSGMLINLIGFVFQLHSIKKYIIALYYR